MMNLEQTRTSWQLLLLLLLVVGVAGCRTTRISGRQKDRPTSQKNMIKCGNYCNLLAPPPPSPFLHHGFLESEFHCSSTV